jgi:predicted AlkP superfamily pyrophosphatase or phosphodiesterase
MFCRTLCLLLTVFVFSAAAQDTTQQIVPGRSNHPSQYQKPYVILISIDGFRADFTEKHGASFLQSVSQKGVRAEYMTPSFPSLTFPNHYTLVTGLYPAHHGLVDNSYYDTRRQQFYGMGDKQQVADGSWYGGTPLWVLAEKQQLLSASFYWVASEADIQHTRPTYYYKYNEQIGMADRINTVKNWLSLPEEKRPHLITFYFPQVDHDAHEYGPDDSRVTTTVQFIDSSINALQQALQPLGLPINYIVVSDHGMTAVNNKNPLPLPKAIDTSKFWIPRGDALLHLYAKDTATLAATYQALKKEPGMNVYQLNETPAHWHNRAADDWHQRLGNLILTPQLPNIFSINNRPISPGKHGFDNHHPDMRATFMAWGPAFKTGLRINGFENIHVYPLIANLLGLPFDEKEIDGRADVLKGILK